MTGKKFLKMIVSDSIILMVLWSIALAATFTTNVGDYKNGDYRSTQKVASSNDYLYVEKSAKWNDAEKTEATVRIEVQSKQKKSLGKLQKADILIIADKSKSAYGYYSAYTNVKDFEKDVIGYAATKFVTGEYAGAGNRVAFMDFAEAAWCYNKNGVIDSSGYSYGDYSKASDRKDYSPLWRGGKESSDSLTNMKAREENLISRYNSLKSTLGGQLMGNTDSLFLSNPTDITAMITNAANFTPSDKKTYTNIDVPLAMANLILERRSDRSRTAFVIFFTDGTPDPIFAVQQTKGMYAMDSTSWKSQDGMLSNTEGYNGTMATARQWRIKNYYPFNFFYKKAGADLRDDAEEIFFLRTGSDENVTGQPYIIWNNITREIGTHGTKDSLWPQVPMLPVNYANKDGDNLSGSTSSNNDNIHVIGSSSSKDSAIKETEKVLNLIETYLKPTSSSQKVPLNCTVTDVINYDLFKIVNKSWTSNNNQSKVSFNTSNNTITWPISGINYGDQISGKWPYLEFKIQLKDNSTGGKINTNYIKNKGKTNDEDKSCKARTGINEEAIDVPSPWLERDADVGNIYANWLVKSGSSYSAMSGIARYEDKNKAYNTYKVRNDVGGRNTSDYIYLGYCVENGNIAANKATVGTLTSGVEASVTLSKDDKNKTIHFIFEEKPAKGSIYANWLLKDGTTYSALPDISRYSKTELDFGDYEVKKNEGSRTVADKYKYIGYTIQNGNITPENASIKLSSIKTGDTAKVNVSDSARVKTVHFVFEEVKGTVKVRHVVISSSNIASVIEPSNKKYNYTDSNITLGSYSATKQYSDSKYKYKGYKIEEGLIASTNYDLETSFKTGDKASLTLTAAKNQYTITFAYVDDTLTEIGVGLQVKHFDTINNTEIPAPEKNPITRKWNDLSDLILSMYEKDSNKDKVIENINIIVSNKRLSDTEKVTKIFNEYISPKWSSCKGLKSYNTTKTTDNKMSVYDVINEMGVKSQKSSSETKISSIDVGNTQRIPDVDEVISSITNKKVLPDGLKSDKMITINIYYTRDCKVTFEHYDKELNKKITTVGDKYVTAKINKDAEYNPTEDAGLKAYTFVPDDTKIVLPATADQKLIKESKETNVKIGPLTQDYTVRLFYVKNRTITFEHYDLETNKKIDGKADKVFKDVKYASNVIYDSYDIPGYTYIPEKTKNVKNGTPIVNANTIEVGPVTQKEDVFRLFYIKDRTLIVKHIDVDTGEEIADRESYSVQYNTRQETASLGAIDEPILVTSDYHYRYQGEYEVSWKPTGGTVTLDEDVKTNIAVTPGTGVSEIIVTYKYKRFWKVEIYYYDDETGAEIKPSTSSWIENKTTRQEEAPPIEYYKFKRNEVFNPDEKDGESSIVTITGNGKIIIKFYYIKKPTIETDVIPPDDIPLPDDPTDPSSPTNPHSPYYNKKLIVLDDIFGIKYTIKNTDRLEFDSEVVFRFPFDVYYGDSFIKAGMDIHVKHFPVGSFSDIEYTDTVYFRLPSWIIEKEYASADGMSTIITLRYDYDPVDYPEDEEDPLSQEEHDITVIGRLYDFTVTAIDENVSFNQAKWTRSLFNREAGVLYEYKADTLPIGQNKVRSNVSTYPVNTNMVTQDTMWHHGLPVGTPFTFSINTKGLLSSKISIEPRLEYYDLKGNKISGVQFKYKADNILVEKDFTNAQGVVIASDDEFVTSLNDNIRRNINQVQKEINYANTLLKKGNINLIGGVKESYANVMNEYSNFSFMSQVKFGTYKRLLIPKTLRLPFVDYYPEPAGLDNLRFNEVHRIGNTFTNDIYYNINNRVTDKLNYITSNDMSKYKNNAAVVEMNQDGIINSLGHWYAEYSLPSTLVVRDSSGKELKDGYIVLGFKIRSMRTDADGTDKEYLTYWRGKETGSVIRYYNSQWTKENNNLTDTNEKYSRTLVPVNFPLIGNQTNVVTKNVDIRGSGNYDGYYPVAIFEAGFSIDDFYRIAGTH